MTSCRTSRSRTLDLQALFERLHDVSYAQAIQDEMKEAQAGMAAIFDELGLDVEVPELRADMTEEDAAAAAPSCGRAPPR